VRTLGWPVVTAVCGLVSIRRHDVSLRGGCCYSVWGHRRGWFAVSHARVLLRGRFGAVERGRPRQLTWRASKIAWGRHGRGPESVLMFPHRRLWRDLALFGWSPGLNCCLQPAPGWARMRCAHWLLSSFADLGIPTAACSWLLRTSLPTVFPEELAVLGEDRGSAFTLRRC